METYYFRLDLGKQYRDLNGKYFYKVITCLNPLIDGLTRFVEEIHKDGRYSIIAHHVSYKKL